MALTFICSLGVATGANVDVRTDADRLRSAAQPGLGYCRWRSLYHAGSASTTAQSKLSDAPCCDTAEHRDPEAARRVIADALPPELAALLPPDQIELMRLKCSRGRGRSLIEG